MSRASKKPIRKQPRPVRPVEPEREREDEQQQPPSEIEEPVSPEEQRAIDQGTLRLFGVLLAIGELVALVWAVRTHAPRTEYLVVAGALALLFGLPMVFAWRSLAHREPDS